MLVAAYVFQFLDFIAHSFVISAQEFAYRDNDVDFIGSGVECHCGFGNFHFREGLRRGETTRNAGYLYIVRLQRAVYDFRHVGVDADGSYVFQVGIFVYKLSTTGAWDLEGNITAEESGNYDQFGLLAAVRDNGIAAIYGQDTDSKANDTLILSIGQNGATTTQQIIHSEEAVTDVGMFFCSAKTGDKNKNFLALVFEATIEIWQQDYSSDKYTLFQIIEDPKSVRDEKDPPYEDQFIEFGSDFSWDKETCTKFVFGSMSKGGQGIYSGPQPYGRAYIFTLTEDEPKNNDVAIIAGSTVAAVVVVAVIIVVVVVLLKKRRYRENAQQLEA